MSDKICCPKCGSDQLTTDKNGFSAGKAVGGAILTGGIGLLAGYHGSKDLIVYCINCGYSWYPKQLAEQKRKENITRNAAARQEWKKLVYSTYQSGDKDAANNAYLKYRDYTDSIPNIDTAYKSLKREDRGTVITLVVIIILIAFFDLQSNVMSLTMAKAPKIKKTDERMLQLIEKLKELGLIRYQQEFCDAVGIEKVNIWNIRNGRRRFTIDQVEWACEAYNVNPAWLFGFEEKVFRIKKLQNA